MIFCIEQTKKNCISDQTWSDLWKGWPGSVQGMSVHPGCDGPLLCGRTDLHSCQARLHLVWLSDMGILHQTGRHCYQVRPPSLHELPQKEHRGLEHWKRSAGLHRRLLQHSPGKWPLEIPFLPREGASNEILGPEVKIICLPGGPIGWPQDDLSLWEHVSLPFIPAIF